MSSHQRRLCMQILQAMRHGNSVTPSDVYWSLYEDGYVLCRMKKIRQTLMYLHRTEQVRREWQGGELKSSCWRIRTPRPPADTREHAPARSR